MPPLNAEKLAQAKSLGFSNRQIAHLTGTTEDAVRGERQTHRPGAELPARGHLRRRV